MIIISQDKRMIINFDNIVGIVIRENTDKNLYQVQCKSENEKNKRILGKYKTEERAKEVLEEIANYKFNNSMVVMNQEEIKWETTNQSEIYYMPEK